MNKIRKQVLDEQYTEVIQKIAKLDIDIAVLKDLDPSKVVSRRKLTEASSREITAGDALKGCEGEKEGLELRLKAIEGLLNGE